MYTTKYIKTCIHKKKKLEKAFNYKATPKNICIYSIKVDFFLFGISSFGCTFSNGRIQTSFASCANEYWMILLYVTFENIIDSEKDMRQFWIQLCAQCALIEKKIQAWQILKYSNNHYKLSQVYCDLLYLIVFFACTYFQVK